MARLPVPFYLGSFFIGAAGPIVIIIAVVRFDLPRMLIVAAIALGLYWLVVTLVLLYKAWDAIQDGFARTTPGRAVGFLFIPLFNAYWLFEAVWGFARDYNRLLERHGLESDPLPERLFLAYCVLTVVALVPGLSRLTGFWGGSAALIIEALLVVNVCDAVNALPDLLELRGQPG